MLEIIKLDACEYLLMSDKNIWNWLTSCKQMSSGMFKNNVTYKLFTFKSDIFVVYWPSTWPNMPFQRRGSCIFHWRRRAWLTIWDKVKSHSTVRLMHRERVTSELYDSYFRSMTIKHAIPRTAEVTHPDGQLWRDIEWAIELLYNSVKTGSQLVLRPDSLVTICGRESPHPAEWGPGPPVEQPSRTRNTNGDGHKSGGQYVAVLFGLQLPLIHTALSNKVRVIFF